MDKPWRGGRGQRGKMGTTTGGDFWEGKPEIYWKLGGPARGERAHFEGAILIGQGRAEEVGE